jgi:penicillin-binding protein 2
MYPPGSTFKPFMALAGLELKKRWPQQAISDAGYFSLPGSTHRFRDWKAGGHGIVDLHKSLVVSCDTYYYGLANDLGIDNIFSFTTQFGLGKKTGIDIEGEVAGLLPSQEWKMKRHKQKWYAGDTISVGIGQGYNLATPLQLAFATAILAGNGTAYRPHLVKKVLDNNNEVVREIVTQPLYTLNLNAANLATVRNALIDVTRPGGTAAAAGAGAAYTFAGKTGTSQVVGMKQGEKYIESKIQERHRDHALFVAYAPAESPKIALSVLVENGGHGGSTAAPIARLVMDYFLLGKLPEESAAKIVEQSGDEEEEMPELDVHD